MNGYMFMLHRQIERSIMNRKIMIIGALLLLVVLLVTGCSPKGSSSTSSLGTADASKEKPSTSVSEVPRGTGLPPSFYLPEIPRVSAEEVKAKLDAGTNIVIVDSRPKASYDQSHIVGAISLPLTSMAEPYSDLDGYDEIISYCT